MPPISLLIKPASSLCNLKCKYCFYHSVAEQREVKSYGFMSDDTLELLVKKALMYADHACTFNFQGGEPTLIGIEFYIKLLEYQKKYNLKGVKINNSIQTNGVLINEEWAKFFANNKFLVGLSLDGPKDIHDMNRIDSNEKGTFNSVNNCVQLFNKYKVEYNILFVVNKYIARHPEKVYNFFRKNGFDYVQHIPCLDPFEEECNSREYSLSSEDYANYLKKFFSLWHEDYKRGKIMVERSIDNYIGMLMGYPPESCGMAGQCSCYFVVEGNGGVYPCDFYVIDEWYLGNITQNTFFEMIATKNAKEFVDTSIYVDPKCNECKWAKLCRGGCRRLREPFSDGKPALNKYCEAYYEYFNFAVPKMMDIANHLRNTPHK